MVADRAAPVVGRSGRRGRRRREGRHLPRACARAAPALRNRLPQRPRLVFDEHWRPVVRRGAFVDPKIPAWYSPFGITVARRARVRHLRVACACERKRRSDRRLRRRVRSRRKARRARRADGRAERAVGARGRAGREARSSRTSGAGGSTRTLGTGARWTFTGQLHGRDGKPIVDLRALGHRVRKRRPWRGRRTRSSSRPARTAGAVRPSSESTVF